MKTEMNKTGFTKGPWGKGENGFGDPFMVYCDDELGSAVADCSVKYSIKLPIDEKLANAKLIAAAPDLLHALELLLNVYRNDGTDDFYNIDPEEVAMNAINKAKS